MKEEMAHLVGWAAFAALLGGIWVYFEGVDVAPLALSLFVLQVGTDWLLYRLKRKSLRPPVCMAVILAWIGFSGGGKSLLWPALLIVSAVVAAGSSSLPLAWSTIGLGIVGYGLLAPLTGLSWAETLPRLGYVVFIALPLRTITSQLRHAQEHLQRSRDHLQALLDAAGTITGELGVKETLESILDKVCQLLGVKKAAILLEEEDRVRVVAARGIPPEQWGGTALSRKGRLAESIMDKGESRIFRAPFTVEEEGLRAAGLGEEFAIVPLVVGKQKLGMLAISQVEGKEITEETLRLLRGFADHAALALYKAKTHAVTTQQLSESRHRVERLELIAEVNRRLSAAVSEEQVLGEAMRGLHEVLGYEKCAILLADRGKFLRVREMRGFPPEARRVRIDLNAPGPGQMLREKKPFLVEDADIEPDREVRMVVKAMGVRSLLLYPVAVHERVEGAIAIGSHLAGGIPSEALAEIPVIADHLGIALEDAWLHSELEARAQELERAYKELEASQRKFLHAARLASIGELAASIAHELNNPLTTILGFSQLVMAELEDGSPLKDDLKVIESEALRTKDIVRRLLDFARETKPEMRKADLNKVVEETLQFLNYQLKASNIKVEKQLDPSIPPFLFDPSQIRQVLTNMVVNACQAMEPKGGGTLKIATRRLNSDWVEIEITDTGIGIPEEHLPRIFDPFFTTKEPGKGTGLGLAVCHGIVSQHGGEIDVRSKVGEGTTFKVKLPIRREEGGREDSGGR